MRGGGGGPKVGGPTRDPLLPNAYLWGDVVLGDGGMYVIIALSRLSCEESLKGCRVTPLPPPPLFPRAPRLIFEENPGGLVFDESFLRVTFGG